MRAASIVFQVCLTSCRQWVSHCEEAEPGHFLLLEQQQPVRRAPSPAQLKYITHSGSLGVLPLFLPCKIKLGCFQRLDGLFSHISDFTRHMLASRVTENCYNNRPCSHEVYHVLISGPQRKNTITHPSQSRDIFPSAHSGGLKPTHGLLFALSSYPSSEQFSELFI